MKKKALAIFGMLAVQAVLPAGAASPAGPLPVDEAFAMTVSPGPGGSLAVEWAIADGYYLYRDRVAARAQDGADQIIETVPGVAKDDPNFGRSEIYYGRAKAVVRRPGAHPVELTTKAARKTASATPRRRGRSILSVSPSPAPLPQKGRALSGRRTTLLSHPTPLDRRRRLARQA